MKKYNKAGQHFVLTNKLANKKQKAHIELKSAAEGIRPVAHFTVFSPKHCVFLCK